MDSLLDDLAMGYTSSTLPAADMRIEEPIADLEVSAPPPTIIHHAQMTVGGIFVGRFDETVTVEELKLDLIREAKPEFQFHSPRKMYRCLLQKGAGHIIGDYKGGVTPNMRELAPRSLEDIEILMDLYQIPSFSYLRNKHRDAVVRRGR